MLDLMHNIKTFLKKMLMHHVLNIIFCQALRHSLLDGTVSAAQLVIMTDAELASSEIKAMKDKIISEEMASRQLDWYEENRVAICMAINVDPELAAVDPTAGKKWDDSDSDNDCTKDG